MVIPIRLLTTRPGKPGLSFTGEGKLNKEVLINPKTGKPKKCWSLDVPGLLADGWKRAGEKPESEKKKPVTTTEFEPIEYKSKKKAG
jgi:hypothetical protein